VLSICHEDCSMKSCKSGHSGSDKELVHVGSSCELDAAATPRAKKQRCEM
jgi:hypothetical protein